MNITKQAFWKIEPYIEGYWNNRAVEDLIEELGLEGPYTLDEFAFASREAAIEFATLLLRKYFELTPHAWNRGHANLKDYLTALAEIGRTLDTRHGVSSSDRWAGEPTISVNERNEVVLTRSSEFQLTVTTKSNKTVEVEGETYTREIEEVQTSAWYPGTPESVAVGVCSKELVIVG